MADEFEAAAIGDDLATGRNARLFRAKFYALAKKQGLDAGKTWAWYTSLTANPLMDQQAAAKAATIDWAGLTAFMVALAPIIEQMMASCPAPTT
jgi:hypothetical protein